MKKILFVLLTIVLCGCVTTARLYNLNEASVIYAKFGNYGIGHAKITAIAPDGEQFEGEYTTLSNMSMSTGFGTASAFSSDNYVWAQAQGFSFNQPGKQFGSAVIVGDRGTVIEIIYAVDPWTSHGSGVAKDNKGNKYRVQF